MNRIKELRQARGWKQDELGEMIQVGKGSVSRYEAETRQLDPATIHALCDLFGCTSDYLLGRSSFRNPVITEEQAYILHTYSLLPPEIRRAVDVIMEPYAADAEEKKVV